MKCILFFLGILVNFLNYFVDAHLATGYKSNKNVSRLPQQECDDDDPQQDNSDVLTVIFFVVPFLALGLTIGSLYFIHKKYNDTE